MSTLYLSSAPPSSAVDPGAVQLWLGAEQLPDFRAKRWTAVHIELEGATDLAGLLTRTQLLGNTAALTLRVAGYTPAGLIGAPSGQVHGAEVLESSFRRTAQATEVEIRCEGRARIDFLLAAVLHTHRVPNSSWTAGHRLAAPLPAAAQLVGLDRTAVPMELARPTAEFGESPGPTPAADTVVESAPTATDTLIFDPQFFNPHGFVPQPARGPVNLAWNAHLGVYQLATEDTEVAGRFTGCTTDLVAATREFTHLTDSPYAHPGPTARAIFLVRATAAGLPVRATGLCPQTRELLGPELTSHLRAAAAVDFAANFARELHAVAGSRLAHRLFSNRVARRDLFGAALGSISVLLSTIRPEFVAHAVHSAAHQTGVQTQILLGLHGFTQSELDGPTRDLLQRHEVQVTEFGGDTIFGDVLAALSHQADGEFLAKIDDDDFYSPHHLEDLLQAADYSQANLVGTPVQLIYLQQLGITVRRNFAGLYDYGGLPGGPTLLLRRSDLDAVGGWARVRRAVDTALIYRLLAGGGRVFQAGATNFVFNRRASAGHTWKASPEYFVKSPVAQWQGLYLPPSFENLPGYPQPEILGDLGIGKLDTTQFKFSSAAPAGGDGAPSYLKTVISQPKL